jgi:hypothetical protein
MAPNSLIFHILILLGNTDFEMSCLVGSFHSKDVTNWAFQTALTFSKGMYPGKYQSIKQNKGKVNVL